jgi:hypothetical protein
MTYINCELPPLDELIERLRDDVWVDYYKKFDSFKGPADSIQYLMDFLWER